MGEAETPAIALAGNPNVGKSTVFNALTGLRQHTGNWAGKTVGSAQGRWEFQGRAYQLVDLPGCVSLLSQAGEERAAREYLLSGQAQAVVVVCDATCLERGLSLVLQVLEITARAVVCVNLLDEAQRKGIRVDLERLSQKLGVPVVGTSAGRGRGLEELLDNYLVKLTDRALTPEESAKVSELLHTLSDFERIGDHATNIAEWVEFSITGIHKDSQV